MINRLKKGKLANKPLIVITITQNFLEVELQELIVHWLNFLLRVGFRSE